MSMFYIYKNERARERAKKKRWVRWVISSYNTSHTHISLHLSTAKTDVRGVYALYPWNEVSFSPQAPPPETKHVCNLTCSKECPTMSSYESRSMCNCSLLPSLFPICLFSLVHADTLAEPFFVLQEHDVISVMQLFFIWTSKCTELSCSVLCILKCFEQTDFAHLSPYLRRVVVVQLCINSWSFATVLILYSFICLTYFCYSNANFPLKRRCF